MPSVSEETLANRRRVREVLGEIVAEHGEDTKARCLYFDENSVESVRSGEVQPVCIVGHLIHRLEPDTFAAMVEVGCSADRVSELRTSGIVLHFVGKDRRLAEALSDLQDVQDSGYAWGAALRDFDRSLPSAKAVA